MKLEERKWGEGYWKRSWDGRGVLGMRGMKGKWRVKGRFEGAAGYKIR